MSKVSFIPAQPSWTVKIVQYDLSEKADHFIWSEDIIAWRCEDISDESDQMDEFTSGIDAVTLEGVPAFTKNNNWDVFVVSPDDRHIMGGLSVDGKDFDKFIKDRSAKRVKFIKSLKHGLL